MIIVYYNWLMADRLWFEQLGPNEYTNKQRKYRQGRSWRHQWGQWRALLHAVWQSGIRRARAAQQQSIWSKGRRVEYVSDQCSRKPCLDYY